jgi:hypothetical protein
MLLLLVCFNEDAVAPLMAGSCCFLAKEAGGNGGGGTATELEGGKARGGSGWEISASDELLVEVLSPLKGFFGGGIYSSLEIDLFIGTIETGGRGGSGIGIGGPTGRVEEPFDVTRPEEDGGTGGGG